MSDRVLDREQHRPALHFSPRRGWMNDPNGLILVDGTYHLFFQHNPDGLEWGNIGWGHATSTDLLHWTELPIAIPAEPHEMIFSGSVVHDVHNTSGFGTDAAPLVAIYTSHYVDHPVHGTKQAQSVAFSTDGGGTWSPFDDNPVDDRDRPDYRDPKVFWHGDRETGAWVMVAVEADRSRLVINTSPDLKHWTESSTFESASVPSFWECPDLFPLLLDGTDERWVLSLSTSGPNQVYLVGDFDGRRFAEDAGVPQDLRYHLTDFGRDNYAAVTFNDTGDRRIMIGWMGHRFPAPTKPWRGIMTIPRELTLRTVQGVPRLVSRIVREADAVVDERVVDTSNGNGVIDLRTPSGGPLRIRAVLHAGEAQTAVRVVSTALESVVIGYDNSQRCVFLDRANSGWNDSSGFDSPTRAPIELTGGALDVDIFIDAMSIEVFAGSGEAVISELVFPSAPWSHLEVLPSSTLSEHLHIEQPTDTEKAL
ncbi:glycoside hydrolase family 32 protein [Plantibacter sp. MMLR14_011]|uniref:glycoside hydrolase family 32 protein n=1 Tax=Plantibacter sp. MMLR14_011 TaxID=1898746 RepID=UPI0008DD5342|nr:glycoside hydrolase family 32 protein [Plantibacter sp. MMLR14_011]OII39255.1 hypothetical protein BIU99_07665 [Plantibacter sp. MMLR14_011]